MSLLLAGVFAWSIPLSRTMQDELAVIAVTLGLRIYPAAQVLTVLLGVFALLLLIVAVGLGLVFFGFS